MPRVIKIDKKAAIEAAAIKIFAAQGLGAPTALIAREADVATGTLFNYFETKADLLNYLYVQLKLEMLATAMAGCPGEADLKSQAYHIWSGWTKWGAAHPDKRRTLALLSVSDEVNAESRQEACNASIYVGEILTQITAKGHLSDQPLTFINGVIESLAGMTIDFMISEPTQAEKHCAAGFETLWRAIN